MLTMKRPVGGKRLRIAPVKWPDRKGPTLMKVLFDVVHPAHALFFCHAMRILQKRGDEICIVSRHKDVTTNLLDELGFSHTPISTAGTGLVGLASELVARDWRLLKIARDFRPDILVGNGGLAISHVGKLLGIPSLSIYDMDEAVLQMSLTIPFIDEWHVPERWNGPVAKGRTHHFRGCRHYTYLHQDHFVADDEAALRAGWDPEQDNFLLRIVAWQSNHDQGKNGFIAQQRDDLVAQLQKRGRLHLSSENALPPELEELRFRGNVTDFHHLLSKCRICVTESMTVASEATALGVPSLLQNQFDIGYITEQFEAGVFFPLPREANIDNAALIDEVLGVQQDEIKRRMDAYRSAQVDLNYYTIDAIDRMIAERQSGGADKQSRAA